jgi:hypothetical protein
VAGTLDGHAELPAHGLQEAQLGLLEGRAGPGGHVEDASVRAAEGERHAGVRDGLLQFGGDRRYAWVLDRVAG